MNQNDISVKMILTAWDSTVSRTGNLIKSLSDEQLSKEIAPGKNTGTYLVGHLIAVSDSLHDILGLGQREHKDLDEPFLKMADKSGQEMPSLTSLRQYWEDVHQKVNGALHALPADDFFKRHNSVSDEDFAKEPHRNKLNVVISRTNHMGYHLGQMQLLK